MNRVATRAFILLVLVIGLFAGTAFFVVEYSMKADQWVMTAGTPQVEEDDGISLGCVTDRNGRILLQMGADRVYDVDPLVRRASVHWLGDRSGNIGSGVVSHYTKELLDYSKLTGTYHYGDATGQLKLTLDASAQAASQQAMGELVGTVAVFNYKTGELICAVTSPNYDPDNAPDVEGDTTGAYEGVYVNRFVRSKYIPGSIFKIVTLAAALESIPDATQLTFQCNGSFSVGNGEVTCEKAHGVQTLKEAFANSCNCAFGELTLMLGKETMNRYVAQFGITESISFDGLNTVKGNYDVSQAGSESFAWSGIGQYTDLVNPCTFLRFVGAIANDGVAVQPYVVEQVSVGSQQTYVAETQEQGRIMSITTARTLQEYMGYNVEAKYGSWNFPDLTVCAKSGTGEVGGDKKPNATFAGFLTDTELPLAFVACIEQGGYGAGTCMPIINQVLQSCRQIYQGG